MSHDSPPTLIGSPRSDVPLLRSARSIPPSTPLLSDKEGYDLDRKPRQGICTYRRSIKTYSIVVIGLTIIVLLASYHGQLEQMSTQGASEAQVVEHPLDSFARGFPKLRGPEETGFMEDEVLDKLPLFDWPRTTKMFVFGDSYSNTDVDYRKNGIDGGHHAGLHGKATDMKWSDYLYAVFHDYHVLQYYNFARPGAVIDPVIIPPGSDVYGTFHTQIDDFEELFTPSPGPEKVNWHSDDSLFVAFFGINDMGRMNREDIGRKDIPTTTAALAASLVNSCRKLYDLGARSFLILNIPPLDHSPKYSLPHEVGILSHDLIRESVITYNQALKREVDAWKKELNDDGDVTIMLFDLESFWNLVLRYPEAFGMTECARYQMWVDDKRTNLGRMGYCYHDNQHISWSAAELIARTINGFMHRHSRSFFENNATEIALRA